MGKFIKLTMSLTHFPINFFFDFFPGPFLYIIGKPLSVYFMSIGQKYQLSVSFKFLFLAFFLKPVTFQINFGFVLKFSLEFSVVSEKERCQRSLVFFPLFLCKKFRCVLPGHDHKYFKINAEHISIVSFQ